MSLERWTVDEDLQPDTYADGSLVPKHHIDTEMPYALAKLDTAQIVRQIVFFNFKVIQKVLDMTHGHGRFTKGFSSEIAVTIDIRKEMHPTVVASFNWLPFREDSFDVLFFDPPFIEKGASGGKSQYERASLHHDAAAINQTEISFSRALEQASKVAMKGALLVWKDQICRRKVPFWNYQDTFIQDLGTIPRIKSHTAVKNYAFYTVYKK